jgi:hypothetical protein
MTRTTWVGAVCLAVGMAAGGAMSGGNAGAQGRVWAVRGSCNRGDVVIAGDGELVCVSPDDLRFRGLSCSEGQFLSLDTWGELRCVGPSTSSSGARGLLPECSSGETLVSEGFGRWRCQSPSR